MADGDGLTARPAVDLPSRIGEAITPVGPSSFEVARAARGERGPATDAEVLAALHRLVATGAAVAEWAPDRAGRIRRRYRATRSWQLLR